MAGCVFLCPPFVFGGPGFSGGVGGPKPGSPHKPPGGLFRGEGGRCCRAAPPAVPGGRCVPARRRNGAALVEAIAKHWGLVTPVPET